MTIKQWEILEKILKYYFPCEHHQGQQCGCEEKYEKVINAINQWREQCAI